MFYFLVRESVVVRVGKMHGIMTDPRVLRSQESEEVVFKNVVCILYPVTASGDESTSRRKIKIAMWGTSGYAFMS